VFADTCTNAGAGEEKANNLISVERNQVDVLVFPCPIGRKVCTDGRERVGERMGKRGRYQFDLASFQKLDAILRATDFVATVLLLSDLI